MSNRPSHLTVFSIGVCCALAGATYLIAAESDAAHWPSWRGPFENGIARTAVPTEWSATKNIAWKVEIPGKGNSSPIIWGDRIFLTTAIPSEPIPTGGRPGGGPPPGGPPPGGPPPGGPGGPPPGGPRGGRGGGGAGGGSGAGIEHKFVLMSLDRKTGKVIWERTATVAKPHEGYHMRYGSFASNSPVTDGKYIFAFFGSRGFYCYDFAGNLLWKKDSPQLKMRMAFGEGVAPVLDGDNVILTFDNEEGSFMSVVSKKDGKEIWRASREEQSSWAQPLVITHNGRRQIVVAATNKVRSYDSKTGKVIWECGGLGANVIPAPVYKDGMIVVQSGFRNPNMLGIKLGKEGDLTGTDSVVWTNTRGNSYTPSPVLDGDRYYFASDNGLLSCVNFKTGEPYYIQQRLPKPYSLKASPVAAGGNLYISTEDGDVVVVKMSEKYEVVATNHIDDEMFVSSPAVAEGALFLRNQKALYCIKNSK